MKPSQQNIGSIQIDETLCQGHGRCYSLAPDLFESDEVGNGQVIREDLIESDLVSARRADEGCPESAVVLTLRPTVAP